METPAPIRGGIGLGAGEGYEGQFLMTGKRWAVAAAFCVLAAPGAFAQKAAPMDAGRAAAGPQSPSAAPAGADAGKTAQFPRLLPGKAETRPALSVTWSAPELELA